MFPSNNNGNNYTTTFSFSTDQPIPQRTFLYYNNNETTTNPNSKLEEYPPSSSSSFHIQYSPYVHLEDDAIFRQYLHDLVLQQQQQPLSNDDDHTIVAAETNIVSNMEKCSDTDHNHDHANIGIIEQIPRKRTSKKVGHSKINTAHGPRDRRMRLSLDVARKFFGLQDMLGFDKASKTVEWLLTKSKTAIKEFKRGLPQLNQSCSFSAHSTNSESCEVLSGIDECVVRLLNDQDTTEKANKSSLSNSCSSKEKKKKVVRKTTSLHHPLAKETRERARARARERTIEKRNNIQSKFRPCLEAMDQDLNRFGSWSPFEDQIMNQSDQAEEPSSRIQLKNGSMNVVADSSLITGNWSPSIFFNYQQNAGISHEHQFTDFQCFGKPWEGSNTLK